MRLESDWKTFRKLVPEWRENYLKAKNQELIALLTESDKTATEQFWQAKERIDKEALILNECLNNHSRSKLEFYLSMIFRHGLIKRENLNQFSAPLREFIAGRE